MANEKRLIDVDKAKKDFILFFGGVSHAAIANKILGEQPTVDAVEVVRCKDCVHYDGEGCLLTYGEFEPSSMGFCYCGERKNNG